MKVQRQSKDRISALPEEIIEKILSLMPIRDALRTSILSRQWRYSWTGMPKISFSGRDHVFYNDEDIDGYKFICAIFHVLLLHRAPILEFSLVNIEYISVGSEINQIIVHLSRSNNIKKLVFRILGGGSYLLPSSFFSLQGLEHLDLSNCEFNLPLMNKGFCMLKSLHFSGGYITAKDIFGFLTICPILEEFTWIIANWLQVQLTENEFVELFNCLSSVQVLEISNLYFKPLAAGGVPRKLPISLVHLRKLVLYVCSPELSYVLSVISSSPNLEKIKLQMYRKHERFGVGQPLKNLLDFQDYSGLNLDRLKELEITSFHNYALEMEFVKLIMTNSPVLETAQIQLSISVSVDEEVKMLRGLVLLPFPRASPTTNLIIKRPKNHRYESK